MIFTTNNFYHLDIIKNKFNNYILWKRKYKIRARLKILSLKYNNIRMILDKLSPLKY